MVERLRDPNVFIHHRDFDRGTLFDELMRVWILQNANQQVGFPFRETIDIARINKRFIACFSRWRTPFEVDVPLGIQRIVLRRHHMGMSQRVGRTGWRDVETVLAENIAFVFARWTEFFPLEKIRQQLVDLVKR